MKRCPECRRDYYDDSLLYCLDDGGALLEGPASVDEPATAILSEPRTEGSEPDTAILQMPVTAAGPASSAQGRALDKRLLALPLLIALIVLGFFAYRYSGPGSRQIESIAVMPLVNESGNAEIEYLSDGMTETLITSLSRIPK